MIEGLSKRAGLALIMALILALIFSAYGNEAFGSDRPAMVNQNQTEYAEAKRPVKRPLDKTHGQSRLDEARALDNLATRYFRQGKYAEAEPLFKKALMTREDLLPPNDPAVISTLVNLGSLYEFQARFKEAEPLLKKALAIQEKVYGQEYPLMATTLSELGMLYRD